MSKLKLLYRLVSFNFDRPKLIFNKMRTSIKVFHWVPRIICILAILFVSMFALDAFTPGPTLWQQLGDFFMHLIPSFILLILLVVAWKWELVGGIIIMVTALGLTPFIFMMNYNRNHSIGMSLVIILIITFPFIIAGFLFIVSSCLKKKIQPRV